jgi:hypothetical protein
VFIIPALRGYSATATPATSATRAIPVAPVAAIAHRPPEAATPATAATSEQSVAGVAHVAVADPRLRDPKFRSAIVAARDGADLDYWRPALAQGRLHLCGNCSSFRFGDDPGALGRCRRFKTEAAPFCAFDCPGFAVAKIPTAPRFMSANQECGGE